MKRLNNKIKKVSTTNILKSLRIMKTENYIRYDYKDTQDHINKIKEINLEKGAYNFYNYIKLFKHIIIDDKLYFIDDQNNTVTLKKLYKNYKSI